MAYYSDTQGSEAGFAERTATRLSEILRNASRAMARRRVARTTYDALAALPTRELDDLGLSRADIRRVSLEAAKKAF